jgi:c(7)-type cytochrome triheme protein
VDSIEQTTSFEKQKRNRKRFLFCFALLFLAACSPGTRQLFFDIPPPSEEELRTKQQPEGNANAQNASRDPDDWGEIAADSGERPAVEGVRDWETAQAQLPEHELGGVDWPVAIEQGLIRPRSGADPTAADAAVFKYDFMIEAKKPKFNAWFPHSAHTPWLGCQNCHGKLFPLRRNPTSMKEMRKGESCGSCHGKVAFSLKQCKRCHTSM